MTKPQARVGFALGGCFAVCLLVAAATAQQVTDEIVLSGHLAPVLMGVFTPDGERAITASSDETARLWDLQSRTEVRQYTRQYTGHTGPLFCLALSADGRTLVTGAQDNTLRVWDVPQTKPIFWLAGHDGAASGLALSTDGRSIASVGVDKRLRLWDTTKLPKSIDANSQPLDPAALSKQLAAQEHPATAVAYRTDGNLIATADDHGRVVLWSPFLDQPQGQVEGSPITSLAFHGNNQQLFAAGNDGLIRVWQLPTPAARQIEGFAAAIQHLVVVSNQPLAVVTTNDQMTRVINLDTSAVVREFPKREKPVTAIALSPNNAVLAIAEEGGRVVLFNMSNGEEQGPFSGHAASVNSIQLHPDNQQIFTASVDGMVRHWRVQDVGQPTNDQSPPLVGDLPKGPAALALTPDGTKLFVGSADGKIRQLRTSDGVVERTLEGHTDAITELMVAPNGQQLASASRDKTMRIWNAGDGSLLHTHEHPSSVTSVSVSPNSQRIASVADDGIVRVFDAVSGLPLEDFSGHEPVAAHVRWLGDSLTLASASVDMSLRIRKTSVVRSFRAHEQAVTDMVLYNGGAQTLSCSADGHVVMNDANSGRVVRDFTGVAGQPQAIASHIDNQRIAAGTTDAKVFVWNAGNAELLQTLAVDGPVRAIAWSVDNQKLAVSTETNKLFIFGPPLPPQQSRPGSELVEHQRTATDSPATRLVFDRDNRTIWASHASGHLAQWSYAAPTQIRQFNHGGPVYGVTTSRDGKTIVSCSTDQTVRVWDATTGQQRFQMNGHQGAVHAVALSPDESFVVSSGADRTLRLWDVVGGRPLKQLATLDETMYSVVVHPNGQLVAAAGADRKVYLFDLITGAIVRTLEGHTDYIHCVAFNSAGTRLLSYGYAGQLRIWEPSSGQLLMEERVGRIGNYAHYNADGSRILLSNGDGTARVFDVPPAAR